MHIAPEIADKANALFTKAQRGLGETLGLEYEELSPDKVVATMPVDERTRQPFGLLHGGASVALAESLASVGAFLNINEKTHMAVGLEINANHIRGMKEGRVRGVATPLHRGASTQVWEIKISSVADGKLVCVSRCTIAVIKN